MQGFSGLSRASQDFVIQTLDPFHDEDFTPAGFPGGGSSQTIVERVRLSAVLSAPASASGGNWDCHLALLPFISSANTSTAALTALRSMRVNNENQITAAGAPGASIAAGTVMAGLMMSTTPSGEGTISNDDAVATFLNPAGFMTGPSRLVSQGFEVVNTTSALNAQGDVTVYRCPDARSVDNYVDPVDSAGDPSLVWLAAHTFIAPPRCQKRRLTRC
jgi:hypothetical protein